MPSSVGLVGEPPVGRRGGVGCAVGREAAEAGGAPRGGEDKQLEFMPGLRRVCAAAGADADTGAAGAADAADAAFARRAIEAAKLDCKQAGGTHSLTLRLVGTGGAGANAFVLTSPCCDYGHTAEKVVVVCKSTFAADAVKAAVQKAQSFFRSQSAAGSALAGPSAAGGPARGGVVRVSLSGSARAGAGGQSKGKALTADARALEALSGVFPVVLRDIQRASAPEAQHKLSRKKILSPAEALWATASSHRCAFIADESVCAGLLDVPSLDVRRVMHPVALPFSRLPDAPQFIVRLAMGLLQLPPSCVYAPFDHPSADVAVLSDVPSDRRPAVESRIAYARMYSDARRRTAGPFGPLAYVAQTDEVLTADSSRPPSTPSSTQGYTWGSIVNNAINGVYIGESREDTDTLQRRATTLLTTLPLLVGRLKRGFVCRPGGAPVPLTRDSAEALALETDRVCYVKRATHQPRKQKR